MEEHGFRGTYYVSAGLLDYTSQVGKIVDIETLRLFHERGHEIGNHTYDHMDCQKASLLGILKSVRRNRRRLTGIMSGSFAYPYGARNARACVAARLCAGSARGISFGINKKVVDLMDLKAARVYSRDGMDDCLELVSECARRGGWLIFYTHDVCNEPSEYGCTPEQLTCLIRSVHDKKLTVATVGKALQLIEQAGGKKGCFVNQESQGDRLCH
ncbi:MAG: polysaccharide deacetylase family protein [Proteobacteria bacterium]|nr:polysaccharide deacetylase family protein [Pseudomonadota bacterium]